MTITRGDPGVVRDVPRTKTDAAYQALRRAIVTGEIGPNEPLDENALQLRYQLSRTPLREALKRLTREQFATWPTHSTPYARGVSANELTHLYQTRIILEEPASRIAAMTITDVQLDRLDEISMQIEELIANGKIYEAVESDHALHLAIAEGSGNRFLAEAVSNLNCGSLRLWYTAHEQLHDQTQTPRHSHLLAALRSRDPDRVAEETRKHILRSHQRQLALQQQHSIAAIATTTGLPTARDGELAMLAAAVQLNSRADKTENVKAALDIAESAARAGAGLIVLPEYTDYLGPGDGVDAVAEPIPGQYSRLFGEFAARLGVTLVAGSCWERPAGDPPHLHNTVTVFTSAGELAASYRKLHLFDVELDGVDQATESRRITPGDHIVTAETDGLQLGIATCYDLRFPEIFRIQALAGSRILTIPSAFRERTGRDHWEALLRTRAIENQCYVVAANQVGTDGRGVSYYGRSLIIDPWGIVLACAPDEPGFILAPIDAARQDRLRRDMPVLRRRRDDVYQLTEVER